MIALGWQTNLRCNTEDDRLAEQHDQLGEVWVRACVLGPERRRTMHAKGKVRGNSDGSS